MERIKTKNIFDQCLACLSAIAPLLILYAKPIIDCLEKALC